MDSYLRGEKAFLKAYGRYDVVLERGEGVYLYDTNKKQYLDFYSGIGVNSFGHGYKPYINALQKQIETLMHVSTFIHLFQLKLLKLLKKQHNWMESFSVILVLKQQKEL